MRTETYSRDHEGTDHVHTLAGQSLCHAHPGGESAHGYFEHEQDVAYQAYATPWGPTYGDRTGRDFSRAVSFACDPFNTPAASVTR